MTTQTALPPFEALKGSSIATDQSQGVEAVNNKSKDKGKKPSVEAKGAAKAKEAEAKAKDTASSQLSRKDDAPAPKI